MSRGSRMLRAKAIFWLTEQLLHQVDSISGHDWQRRETKGMFPIQNLLTRYMALAYGESVAG